MRVTADDRRADDTGLALATRNKMMRICTCMTIAILAAATASITGCSTTRPEVEDAGVVDAPAPGASCDEMQRAYVNSRLAPGQESDVALAVAAVLQASDFPQAMPYCSGTRPGPR